MNFSISQKTCPKIPSIFIFILLLSVQIGSSFHWNGNILYDLESNTKADFTVEAVPWTLSGYVSAGVKFYNCAGSYVMGGYNVLAGSYGGYFQRTYSSLPTHNQIYLQMKFFQIDSWDQGMDGTDYFMISIDGNLITGWYLDDGYSGTYSLCGSGYVDFVFTLSLVYPHSASSLTLKMITETNQPSYDESFGFRDIQIEFLTNASPYTSLCAPGVPPWYLSDSRCSTSCTSSGNSITPAGYGFCFPSSCSANCRTCSDTSATCTSCPTGSFLIGTACYSTCDPPLTTKLLGEVTYCDTPCPGGYVWWDGSCSSSCSYVTSYGSYGLVGKTTNTFLECAYPCATNQYLYWNTSCLSSCPSPLIKTTYKGQNFCEYPCTSSQHLYWNGSCLSTCPSPLKSEIQGGGSSQRNFCWYTCAETDFLYWNGSCINSCPSPLSPEIQGTYQQRHFCWYVCSETQYLYWNGSCLNSCPSPLAPEIQYGVPSSRKFCWYPCAEAEFVYWNGSCINNCPSPLSPEIQGTYQQRHFCWYTCAETDFLYWNGSCINNCPYPLASETQYGASSSRKFCWYPCAETEFLYWNGSCSNACPYPLASETQSSSHPRKFCWYTCFETQYLYWNGSCVDTCPSPLTPEIQYGVSSNRNFCWYTCAETDFLYWNGSCINNCPSPLSPEIQGTYQQRHFCWYVCSETQYLYWNGSCLNSCPSPLAPEIQYGVSSNRKFCWYPCAEAEFLYWNGSCINNCPSPLSPEIQGTYQQRHFCWYTCQPSEYLYWNQSCSSQCPIPLVRFDLSGNQFCFLPCSTPAIYWYQDFSCRSECNFPYNLVLYNSVSQCLKPCSKLSEWFYDFEKECHDTCDPPYIRQTLNTIKVCHIDGATLASEINKIKSTTEVIETLGKVTSIILKATSVPQLSAPRTPLLVQLSALIQYIRYMRINYPWRVQLLFQSNDASLISLNFDFSIPNKVEDKLDNYPLPDVFEKYNLDSNFINNMWDLINTALLAIFGIPVLLLLSKAFKKSPKISWITTRTLHSLRWNIPLALISGGAGEIIFFASLQIRNTPLDSAISVTSFILSLLMIFWIIAILAICLKLLWGFHLHRQKVIPSPPISHSKAPDWLGKWKGYEILYTEIEEKYLFSLAYMVVYVIRAILFFGIIANLYDFPLTQSILINVTNLLIFIYLLYYKPLKDIWNTTQLLINEILGNILTICVLTLAIMDRAEIEARYSRMTIGNVMIIVMLIFYILGVVFLVIEGILFGIEAYKTWKEMRARGIKNPFKMIQILLFGETKTHPEEVALEPSQDSSRIDTSSIHLQRNYPQQSDNNKEKIDHGNGSQITDDVHLDSSSRYFLPVGRVKPTGNEITESDIQEIKMKNTEFEGEIPQANKLVRKLNPSGTEQNKEISFDENTAGLAFSPEPTLQPNINFIQNWGNLKARMKRFNQSIHKIHWPSEE